MTRDGIQVASVQTLVRRIDKYAEPDLLIIDEAHHSVAGSWAKIIKAWPNTKILGVTATPTRLDGRGLGAQGGGPFDELVIGPSVGELIDAGYLTQPVVYAPQTVDMEGVKVRAGDYDKGETARRVDKAFITGSAVEHYRRLCPGVPAIAFCASIEHARHVAEEFRAAGFRAECIDGSLSDMERRGVIESLGSGGLDVLTSCEIVSEGTDIPVVGAAILLRPTASLGLFLQQVGRALRPYPGKENTIILDHVGNCLRHGLPDDDREWSLAGIERRGRKKKNQEPPIDIRRCPRCFMVHRPAPICPSCGHVYESKVRQIEQKDGELKQIDTAEREARRREINRAAAQAKTLEELYEVAKKFGFKKGWAWFRWNARQKRLASRV